jgi:hypothetical protein
MLEDTPSGEGARVVMGALGEGRVVGLDDILESRQRLLGRPELEILAAEDVACRV